MRKKEGLEGEKRRGREGEKQDGRTVGRGHYHGSLAQVFLFVLGGLESFGLRMPACQ